MPCDQRWVEVQVMGISCDMIGLNILRRLLGTGHTCVDLLCDKNNLERMSDMKGLGYCLHVYFGYNYSCRTNDEST